MKLLLLLLLNSNLVFGLVGNKAPDFDLQSMNGKSINLGDYKGKIIVLEWTNHGCPFVRKHYDSDNMQSAQEFASKNNVVWFSIISSAKGKQGHSNPEKAKADYKKYKSQASNVLLDKDGAVGKLYGAKTTPHMFVINKDFNVVYEGAIDSIASADPKDISNSKNYIVGAIKSLRAGKKLSPAKTKAYGCSVKY